MPNSPHDKLSFIQTYGNKFKWEIRPLPKFKTCFASIWLLKEEVCGLNYLSNCLNYEV